MGAPTLNRAILALVGLAAVAGCKQPGVSVAEKLDCEPTRLAMIAETKKEIDDLKKPVASPDLTDPLGYANKFDPRKAEIEKAQQQLNDLERKPAIAKQETDAERIDRICRTRIKGELSGALPS